MNQNGGARIFLIRKAYGFSTQKKKACRFFANGCELEEEGCFFLRETENFRFFENRAIKYPGKAEALFTMGFTVLLGKTGSFYYAVSGKRFAQNKSIEVSF